MTNSKNTDAAFDVASTMADVKFIFTAAELCGVGQLAATCAKLGLLQDPYANLTGKKIFLAAQDLVKQYNVDVHGRSSSEIIDSVDRMSIPDVQISIDVVGLTAYCGSIKMVSGALGMLGGPTMTGWDKMLQAAVVKAREIMNIIEMNKQLNHLAIKPAGA